jgi:hypothetical protein
MFDLVVVGLCTDAVLQVAGFYLEESRRSNKKMSSSIVNLPNPYPIPRKISLLPTI